jgi:uncharacterized protein (TIGR00725 family)
MLLHVDVNDWPQRAVENMAALAARQRSANRHRQPVALIGPGDGGDKECAAAERVAASLAVAGMAIVCGGRNGVMEAAARGATKAGGIVIGLLPEEDASAANGWLTVALPTGMGEMRNALIARSAVCLVAIGGGMGTLSEMALGLKWSKPVFTLYEDIQLPDAHTTRSVDELIACVGLLLVNE